jgi:hypothetical protein
MNNIVVMQWYDKGSNLTFTALTKFGSEKDAFKFARKYIRDKRAEGVEAIASPIDADCLKDLVNKGIIDSEWYDPIKKEYCTIDAL